MTYYPSRCHHIKVNGTQCGSPALRTRKLCFFHQRSEDERAQLIADRAAKRASAIDVPILEDANSIQISITQTLRLIVSGQIEAKTAGLVLYGLQTASANLRLLNLSPYMHNVVVDPNTVDQTLLNGEVWKTSDFISDEEYARAERTEAVALAEREAARRAEKLRWAEAEGHRIMLEGDRERAREAAAKKQEEARIAAENAALRKPAIRATIAPPAPAPEAMAAAPAAPVAQPVVAAPAAPPPPATKPAAAITAPARSSPAARASLSRKLPAQKSISRNSSPRNSTPRNSMVMTSLSLASPDDPPPPKPPISERPPKRFPPFATADEIKNSVREQILHALPEVAAAFAEKRNGDTG